MLCQSFAVQMTAAFAAAWLLNTAAVMSGAANAVFLAALALCLICLFFQRKKPDAALKALLAASFMMGLGFILQLPYDFSWHDLAAYSADFSEKIKPDGHLGYIAWIVENGRLPVEYDPRIDGYSVFYNPPLYHILQAVWMKVNLALGLEESMALENLQVLTFLCAFGSVYTGLELMKEMGLGRRAQRAGLLALAFQPMWHLLGATLNNDMLMIFCALRCCLAVCRWIRTRGMKDILSIALWLGLGMAAKLNCALLIPCIAAVFVYAFFKEKPDRRMGYIKPFAAFLGVSVPIAMAWPVYHMIAFGMPFTYVRLPAETINVSEYSLWARYGIPDWFAIRGLFYSPTRKINHNVWMQTLKTGVFDELTLYAEGTVMWYVTYLFLVLFAVLLLTALALFVRMVLTKDGKGVSKLFLMGYGALLIASYLQFSLQYPYICTFNFRYIAPVLALCALAFAHFRDTSRFGWMTEGFAALYSILGMVVYTGYFLK